jgi:hypothetical protein
MIPEPKPLPKLKVAVFYVSFNETEEILSSYEGEEPILAIMLRPAIYSGGVPQSETVKLQLIVLSSG